MTEQPTVPAEEYTGTSKVGDFQEALNDAVSKAKAPRNIVMWKLLEVSGVRGGFANANEVTVTIQIGESSG